MDAIHLYAAAANLVVASVFMAVAVRLVLLARTTRQLPELLLGLSFLAASFALPAYVAVPFVEEGLLQRAIRAVGATLVATSIILVLVFVYRVFRPGSRVALFGACGIGVLLALSCVVNGLPIRETPNGAGLDLMGRVGQVAAYAWAAIETFFYQRNLRRRQRLGLAPESPIANRLALFCLGFSLSAMLYSWGFLVYFLRAFTQIQLPTLFVTATLGLAIAGSIWLAFFPLGATAADQDQ